MPSEYTLTHTVSISDCDARAHWRPSSILIVMQELAEVHAASLGFSRAMLIENGMVWVLYRQRIMMHSYPTYGDVLRITTWPGAIEGPIFPRHFRIEREDGTLIGEASSSWILMDINTRRPMRPSALPGTVVPNEERPAPMPLPGMLRIQEATPVLDRSVRYSDVDVNGHMNNTRYVDWICDMMDYDQLVSRGLAEWQINYISEAKPGEAVQLLTQVDGDATLVQGKRAEDGRTIFEARVALMG